MKMSPRARIAAVLVALVAWAVLLTQVWLSTREHGGLAPALWVLTRYFTLLTNFMVALSFAAMALLGRTLGARWLAGLTLWILIVGVVYHVLLARLYHPQGLDWWTDQGLHSADPALTALFWLAFAPKHGLSWRLALVWLAWPLLYVVYALIRSPLEGIYPYFFIDAAKLGYGQVTLNSLGLCAAFWVGGMAIVGLGKLLRQPRAA